MASDWFTRIYRSILAEQISSKIEIWRRLRALLEPAIRIFSLDRKNNILIGKKEYKYSRSFRNEIKKTEAKDQFLLQTGVFLENEI